MKTMQFCEPISILCTRKLPHILTAPAVQKNIIVDIVPFIQTTFIAKTDTLKPIESLCVGRGNVFVFTSAKAVEALAQTLIALPLHTTIFCLSGATKKAVDAYWNRTLTIVADNAVDLAHKIVTYKIKKIIFICGKQHLNILPEILQQHNIACEKYVVYETIATPQQITKEYNGILFFSPSAVASFFSCNKNLGQKTTLFAIGTTTASSIADQTKNVIITSSNPSVETMIANVVTFFTKH